MKSGGNRSARVESVKAVSEIYAPSPAKSPKSMPLLVDAPEKINTDPHGAAWLVKIQARRSQRSRRA